MGASNSKIEDDKALTLCRERKRFVKQALNGRCLLAAAHVSYVQSLKNTGTALRKFTEPQALDVTSPTSQVQSTFPSLPHHAKATESLFLSSSLPPSTRFHANPMAAARLPSITIEEQPPVQLVATVQSMPPSKILEPHSNENSFHLNHMKTDTVTSATFEERSSCSARAVVENSLSEAPPWDYFGLFHPLDNQFSIEEGKMLGHGLDNDDDIRHLREYEGIPELEEAAEQAFSHKNDDSSVGSGDDFDQISDEPLVQIYKNRYDEVDDPSTNTLENGEIAGPNIGLHHIEKASKSELPKNSSTTFTPQINEKWKPNEDFFSCIREIEALFSKASDFGGEVPRMLEASKLQFSPLFTEEIVHKWKASAFLASCFTCCKEDVHFSQAPVSNEIKYLPWHGSMPSRSSSSRIPFGSAPNDTEDSSSNLFGNTCMNSGSHASTLDRLYAWEKKLYDEVKASGVIRREYDLKCKLLRLQDSRAENAYKIDKTRAAVKDLHSRIRVAIHRIESISKSIEELRDKELQPQLEELIGGLTRMWTMMLECHTDQHKMMSNSSNGKSHKAPAPTESRRQAVMLLQFELSSLLSSFIKWIAAHKSYLKPINNWLLKCVLMAPVPKHKPPRRRPFQFSPRTDIAPPIFVSCRDWITLMDDLPSKQVEAAIIDLIQIIALFLPHPEKGNSRSLPSFSLSRLVKSGEQYGEIDRNELFVDRSLNYGVLQSGLVVFLDSLRNFAKSSLDNYEALQNAIDDARARYEKSDIRR